jgi:hypothetical protein
MLPPGVGRTDGTGDPLPGGLPAGYTGGTTPACALSPFGIQIGGVVQGVVLGDLTYPYLQRVLMDFDGTGPAVLPNPPSPLANASVVFVRPPSSPVSGSSAPWQPTIVASALRIGFPLPAMGPEAQELWAPDQLVLVGISQPNRPLRQRLMPQPGTTIPVPAGIEITVQLVSLVYSPIPGGACNGQLTTLVAGPALWIDN